MPPGTRIVQCQTCPPSLSQYMSRSDWSLLESIWMIQKRICENVSKHVVFSCENPWFPQNVTKKRTNTEEYYNAQELHMPLKEQCLHLCFYVNKLGLKWQGLTCLSIMSRTEQNGLCLFPKNFCISVFPQQRWGLEDSRLSERKTYRNRLHLCASSMCISWSLFSCVETKTSKPVGSLFLWLKHYLFDQTAAGRFLR